MDGVLGEIDVLDLGEAEVDAAAKLGVTRPDDLLGLREPERDEQKPGLVEWAVVAVDDRDTAPSSLSKRRASRLASNVPPVPPPRMTIRLWRHRTSHPGRWRSLLQGGYAAR